MARRETEFMATFNTDEFREDPNPFWVQLQGNCFYCGEKLTGKQFVYWQGNDEKATQVWFHPACAQRLAMHLIKDFLSIEPP